MTKTTARIVELRKQGMQYREVAEMLGLTVDYVKKICRLNNLRNQDIGLPTSLKGRNLVDWPEKIIQKTEGRFELVEQHYQNNGESRLIIRCLKCGELKDVSSISIRKRENIRCTNCFHIETAWKSDRERELDKQEREWRKQVDRGRSLKQMSMNFCRCGALLPWKAKSCDKCKQESRRNQYRHADHRRRARERGAEYESGITLEKLYKRDRGVCYICNKTCDWSDFQKVNGAFIVGGSYPTVEHVKALCNGGSHTWGNVKLACFACNVKKGGRESNAV